MTTPTPAATGTGQSNPSSGGTTPSSGTLPPAAPPRPGATPSPATPSAPATASATGIPSPATPAPTAPASPPASSPQGPAPLVFKGSSLKVSGTGARVVEGEHGVGLLTSGDDKYIVLSYGTGDNVTTVTAKLGEDQTSFRIFSKSPEGVTEQTVSAEQLTTALSGKLTSEQKTAIEQMVAAAKAQRQSQRPQPSQSATPQPALGGQRPPQAETPPAGGTPPPAGQPTPPPAAGQPASPASGSAGSRPATPSTPTSILVDGLINRSEATRINSLVTTQKGIEFLRKEFPQVWLGSDAQALSEKGGVVGIPIISPNNWGPANVKGRIILNKDGGVTIVDSEGNGAMSNKELVRDAERLLQNLLWKYENGGGNGHGNSSTARPHAGLKADGKRDQSENKIIADYLEHPKFLSWLQSERPGMQTLNGKVDFEISDGVTVSINRTTGAWTARKKGSDADLGSLDDIRRIEDDLKRLFTKFSSDLRL